MFICYLLQIPAGFAYTITVKATNLLGVTSPTVSHTFMKSTVSEEIDVYASGSKVIPSGEDTARVNVEMEKTKCAKDSIKAVQVLNWKIYHLFVDIKSVVSCPCAKIILQYEMKSVRFA